MPLAHPIRVTYDDDWTASFVEIEAGEIRVTVVAPDGRAWVGQGKTMEDADALAQRIRQAKAIPVP